MNAIVFSPNYLTIILTLILLHAFASFVKCIEVFHENKTTANANTIQNDNLSHIDKQSSFLKHHVARNKTPTSEENLSTSISVESVAVNRSDNVISSSIEVDNDKYNPGLKYNSGFSEYCDAQYLCGTSTKRSVKSFLMCRNGVEICTKIPHILKQLYSCTCGRCNHHQQSYLKFDRSLQKSQYYSALAVSTIKTTKLLHYQGGVVTFMFSKSAGETIGYSDWIKVVYANVTKDYLNAETIESTYLYDFIDSPNGTESMYIDWKPGTYKAVMFSEYSGPVRAISNTFQVVKQTGGLISNSETYSQSETIYVVAFDFKIPLRSSDLIRIIPANVSRNFVDAPYTASYTIGDFSGSRNSVVDFFADWAVGQYKAVLFLSDYFQKPNIVLAVSNTFELTKLPVVVSSQKLTYYQGEDIVVKFNNTRGVPFNYNDRVGIVLSNVTNDFESAKFIKITNLFGEYGSVGNLSFYANIAVQKYRAVFLLRDSYIGVVSQVLEVKANRIQLNTTESTYYQGGEIILKIKSLSGVKFGYGNLLKIISANITKDYNNAPSVFSTYLYDGYGLSSYDKSISVNWNIGKYKAVFFLQDMNDVQAVSNEFKIMQNIIQFTLSKTTYYQGETMVLTVKSISGVPFRYFDFVRIVSASITKDYYNAPYVYGDYMFDAYGLTSGSKSINVDWNIGKYKAVFFLEDYTNAQAVSNAFTIS